MSIENVLTAALFKRDEGGRTIVFPNVAMGRGYVVPDAATEQKMRRTLMWWIIGAGMLGGLGSQIMSLFFDQPEHWTASVWVVALAGLLAFGVMYRAMAARLTRGMVPVPQRLGVVEGLEKQAEALPRWYLWLLAIFAPLMIAGSAFWMVAGLSIAKLLLGLAGIALFGAIMKQAIHGLTHRPQT